MTEIRRAWPLVKIVIRGDGGFCREPLMRWCEENGVDYVLGLPKNPRLQRAIAQEMRQVRRACEATGKAARVYCELRYRTRASWSRERRVVGKAEHLAKGANPRFIVTSLSKKACRAWRLYQEEYCGRGDMENRIKEQQLGLFANRTSAHALRANQVRLWLSTTAYVVMRSFREFGLAGTELERAQCDTIRNRLLKVGAVIRVTVRRVWLSLSASWPHRELWEAVCENLAHLIGIRPVVVEGVGLGWCDSG